MDVFYELPPRIELSLDEYRLINEGLEAGLVACDEAGDVASAPLRIAIEVALRLLAHRIWPELAALDDEEEQ